MDNIIQIDAVRIERNRPRKCVCKVRKYTIDPTNREVTCECGIVHDPFEAFLDIARHYERINDQQHRMDDQRKEWMKQKPHSVLFKQLEQHYRRGTMWPVCPKCGDAFDFCEITEWYNSEFIKRRKQGIHGRL